MWATLRRLLLSISLIAITSTVLLLSDLERRPAGAQRVRRIAILQHASSPVLDEGVAGMLDALATAGCSIWCRAV
jgi:hypothetical protein